MKPSKTLAEGRKQTDSDEMLIASVEFVIRTKLHDSVETDSSIPFLEGLLLSQKTVEKMAQGKLGPHSFSLARHWTTASVRKGSEMASR